MDTFNRFVTLSTLSLTATAAFANPVVVEIPEPATLSMLFIGLFGLGLARRKVKSANK